MGNNGDFPRTLIVGTHFTGQTGSGTFLGRLFSGWPVDRLATVSNFPSFPDWQRCRLNYQTGDLEFHLRMPFKWLVPANPSATLLPPATLEPQPKTSPKASSASRRMARFCWRMMLRFFDGGEILYHVDPSPDLLKWVRDFKPEVIYGHCSSLNSVLFLLRVQQALKVPLVLHLMDDWAENLYRKGWLSRLLRPHYLVNFVELVRSANVTIGICQEMATEYQNRYRRQFLCLPMPVDLASYQAAARNQWSAGRPFRLRYGGRAGWAIRESLADIAQAVHALRQQSLDVVFDIVTHEKEELPAACFSCDGVVVQTPGALTDLPQIQAEADVLVIGYDFDQDSFRHARFSMPAKMAPCMASGTPILVYGPPGLPVVEYARREGWGKVVDHRNPKELLAAIRELMDSAILREKLGRTGLRLAAEAHDVRNVSENFRTILANAADIKTKIQGGCVS